MKPSIIRNKGFTLIEVMIAVFVLAIGILGVAGLQLFANQNTYEANQRTTAAALASSMIERMRRNPEAADNTTADDNYIDTTAPVVADNTAPACGDSAANACTPIQLAAYDLQAWHNKIAGITEVRNGNNTGGLVAPSACITQPPGYGAKEYRISIAWRGRSPLSDPTADLCGQNAQDAGGNYLYGDSVDDNRYRRVYFIDFTLE